VVICLEQGADLHMAQLMPLLLTVSCFSKIQIDLPFWYRLTWVVPEKGSLNGCVCVCVLVSVLPEFILFWLPEIVAINVVFYFIRLAHFFYHSLSVDVLGALDRFL